MTRKYWLLLPMAVFSLAGPIGCGSGNNTWDGSGDGGTDTGVGDNVLEAVTPLDQFLRHNQTVDLTVLYHRPDGSPISGAQIGYEITTNPAGSQLSAMAASTGTDGRASVRLTTGTQNANFRVQVTPPSGNTLTYNITVSETAVGSLRVRMTYNGETEFNVFVPRLFRDVRCAQLSPSSLPTALLQAPQETELDATPRFDGLEPANNYTVGIIAQVNGDVQGWGCSDLIEVVPNTTREVTVAIRDLDQDVRFQGIYDLENEFDFGGGLPPSVDLALNVFAEIMDDENTNHDSTEDDPIAPDMAGEDPGAFFVELVMRQMCKWPCENEDPDWDNCEPADHRIGDLEALYEENFQSWGQSQPVEFGACGIWEFGADPAQDIINDYINDVVPEKILTITRMVGDVAESITRARIRSTLTIQAETEVGAPFTHVLETMQITLHDFNNVEHVFNADLSDVGFSSLSASETAGITGDQLTISQHQFSLHFGELVAFIFVEGLVKQVLGYDDVGDMLADLIDCASVAQTVKEWITDTILDLFSESQLESYCESGLEAGGNALENAIPSLIDEATVLVLSGVCTGENLDNNDVAHDLTNGVWEGQWTDEGEQGTVEGTFTGELRM